MGSNAGALLWPSEFVGESEDCYADYSSALHFADTYGDDESAGVDRYAEPDSQLSGVLVRNGAADPPSLTCGQVPCRCNETHRFMGGISGFREPGPSTSAHTAQETRNPGTVVIHPGKVEQEAEVQNGKRKNTTPPQGRDGYYHDDTCVRVLKVSFARLSTRLCCAPSHVWPGVLAVVFGVLVFVLLDEPIRVYRRECFRSNERLACTTPQLVILNKWGWSFHF